MSIYKVVRYDLDKKGLAKARRAVDFDNERSAINYVWVVRDAIERWKDNSIVALYQGDKCIPVSKRLARGDVS